MSKRQSTLYLRDILEAVTKIEGYTDNVSYDKFVRSQEKMDAVVRNLEIIGEAAKNVPQETKEKYPEIPWEKMVSLRNKVLHEYFGVDIEILWKTIREDLPLLKKQFENFYDKQTA